ncbi:MAG: hypothetical protein KKC75_05050 [Nanoarchaeota archaeon]|nr:hypothetical protein [Nanoarchaeota archaeon]MBU1004821.1 hypothetical protein [Nanoarchaeota archaeon]MBU1946759.1 hypothetical protein [Nanoarchaeota archaeon]
MKSIDYYIYLDYSEKLVGYIIVKSEKVGIILPKISKFHHYKDLKHKKSYLSAVKKTIESKKILEDLLKHKIRELRENLYIFIEVIEFIKTNDNCVIFASIDDNQYRAFVKLISMIPDKCHTIVRKESELKKGSAEYRLSLIIDTLLNIKRNE